MDADTAIWVGTADTRISTGRDDSPGGAVVRVRQGGEVLSRVEHDRPIFGRALGGPDPRTLFLLASQWRGTDQVADVVAARTGQVLTCKHRREASDGHDRGRKVAGGAMVEQEQARQNALVQAAMQELLERTRAVTQLLSPVGAGAREAVPDLARSPVTPVLAARLRLLESVPPVPDIDVLVQQVQAKRLTLAALQAELAAFDHQLQALEQAIAPGARWAHGWSQLAKSLTDLPTCRTVNRQQRTTDTARADELRPDHRQHEDAIIHGPGDDHAAAIVLGRSVAGGVTLARVGQPSLTSTDTVAGAISMRRCKGHSGVTSCGVRVQVQPVLARLRLRHLL